MAHASAYHWSNIDTIRALFVVLATVLTAAAGNVINDIFDIEEDQINNPEKRIIARHISPKSGRIFYTILAAISLICAFQAGYSMFALSLTIGILLYFYSSDLKGENLWGNLLISFMTGAVVFAADLGVHTRVNGYFAEYALLAFLITMPREIVKDIEDIEGDKAQEYNTYPIAQGIDKAALLASIFLILIIVEMIYIMIRDGNLFYNIYSTVLVVIPAFMLIIKIKTSKQKGDYSKASLYLKGLILTGLLSVLFL